MLESINFDEIENDADALVQAAFMRQELNMGGDLPFAYQARSVGIKDKEAHRNYIRLFLERSDKESEELNVAQVEIDHFVELKNKRGEITTYHIVDQDDYDLTKGEIPVTDARATKLLGLKTKDVVVFDEGEPTEIRYEITDVKHKYVYAFQESIKKYNEWFGGGGFDGLMVMNVGDGDFSSLFKLVASQRKQGRLITDEFREGQLPLATLARMNGKSLFEIWFSVVKSSGLKIIASSGRFEQLEKEIETVKNHKEIVVDSSALLTLRFLGLLNELPRAFSRLLMTKAVDGNLRQWRAEFDAIAPFSVIWEDTGEKYHRRLTNEEVESRREFIDEIVLFVDRHAEILPATKVLTIPGENLDEYYSAFGAGFTSVLLADEHNLPLYLDDFQLGQIGKSLGWEINEVSVQAVLMKFKKLGLISQVDYWNALKKLLLANYAYISIDSNALWWMCEDEEKRATPAIQKILSTTLGSWCSGDSAIRVGSEFINRISLEVRDENEKTRLIDFTLDAVLHNRNEAVETELKGVLTIILNYSPALKELVFERIDSHNFR